MSHAINESVGSPRKNKILATLLNCLFPGLGFFYIGKWGLGLINIAIAQAIILGCMYSSLPALNEHIHWVMLVVIVGSASWIRHVVDVDSAL